jgi:hypothetical protein
MPTTGGQHSENFLHVFKAARNGPLAPPPGRVPAAAAGALRRARLTPVGWREDANTRAAKTSTVPGCGVGGAGSRPDAAPSRARRGHGVAAVARLAAGRDGAGGAECAGPPLQAQGRYASQATAACGRP